MNDLSVLRAWGERQKYRFLQNYAPYPWQLEFHNAGSRYSHRALFAANRVGKTRSGAAELAFNATGLYPPWWQGRVFDKPIEIWCASISNELQKEGMQKALLGPDLGEGLGTMMIPRDLIIGKPDKRQCGISDVCDVVKIRHVSGGLSKIKFKSYEQGDRMFQSGNPDIVALDEQPDENAANEKKIFSEVVTRLVDSGGLLLVTMTPLLGETDLTRHFMAPKPDLVGKVYWRGATWDDAPHLTEQAKALAIASYPQHEVQTRTTGIPMMGEGAVFDVSDRDIACAPFEPPKHFRFICGIDFGYDHPQAGAWIAYDADKDTIYVTDCYRMAGHTVVYHASAIKKRGEWIPVAWPHDGVNKRDTGKGKAESLYEMYRAERVNMLPLSARYDDDSAGSQAQEPIIIQVIERMRTGRFKVFSNLSDWFDEKRSYHRKDGKIVAIRDDILKATFYAVMMLRYAVPRMDARPARREPEAVNLMWA